MTAVSPTHVPDPQIGVAEMVDALLLFDEPILNSRYHGMLARYPEEPARAQLVTLPNVVLQSEREARLAAAEWTQLGPPAWSGDFVEGGQRTLLESFLTLIEHQLRMIAFLGRNAPTASVRKHFDEMARLHREVAARLREALSRVRGRHLAPAPHTILRSVQEENSLGNLRERLEGAIRAALDAGVAIRSVRLSHVALRHLRDQGCFAARDTTLMGIPVVIDQSWEASAFALEGYHIVPLDELVLEMAEGEDA